MGDDNQESSLFTLDGFESEHVYGERTGEAETDIGDIAFPQSDDEDSSTNGNTNNLYT